MKTSLIFSTAFILVLLSLGGCTSFHIREADEQLTVYYNAKQLATANNDWRMLESIQSSFLTLAADAAAQGEKEKGNVLNQIAFYRIATTAAWQGGDAQVVAFAEKGDTLCSQGDNYRRAPRDCAMLVVFPIFAGVDETTAAFNQLQDHVTTASPERRRAFQEKAEEVFFDYRDGFILALRQRNRMTQSSVDPSFLNAFDRHLGKILCEFIEINATGLIATVQGDVAKATCEIYRLKAKSLKAGLRHACADCLPPFKDVLPKPDHCP